MFRLLWLILGSSCKMFFQMIIESMLHAPYSWDLNNYMLCIYLFLWNMKTPTTCLYPFLLLELSVELISAYFRIYLRVYKEDSKQRTLHLFCLFSHHCKSDICWNFASWSLTKFETRDCRYVNVSMDYEFSHKSGWKA